MIDLRSDTVTQPTAPMLEAMMKAKVGDDVLGDDPTVIELQEEVATLFGKEAGLFVPSGTMSNQIAIKIHTQPGTEVICDIGAHIYNYEAGGPAFLSGVQIRTLDCGFGILEPDVVEASLRFEDNIHFAPTALIELENTHNRGGGTIFPLEKIQKMRTMADKFGLPLHLDGARIWNASVATGIPLSEYGKYFETVSVCFSKGLGAPVGSMLLGDAKRIRQGVRYRKLFGGGMRQSGYLAAAALFAVRNNIPRMADDHANAKMLAEAVAGMNRFTVILESVHTNIVMVDIKDPEMDSTQLAEALEKHGVRCLAIAPKRIRLVFHLHISQEDTKKVIEVFEKLDK
jgi:threonine aldolase